MMLRAPGRTIPTIPHQEMLLESMGSQSSMGATCKTCALACSPKAGRAPAAAAAEADVVVAAAAAAREKSSSG